MFQKTTFFSLHSIALLASVTLAADASAGLQALGRPVENVPDANPVEVMDIIISSGFVLDLRQQARAVEQVPHACRIGVGGVAGDDRAVGGEIGRAHV